MPKAVGPLRLAQVPATVGSATTEADGALLWSTSSSAIVVSSASVLLALGTTLSVAPSLGLVVALNHRIFAP